MEWPPAEDRVEEIPEASVGAVLRSPRLTVIAFAVAAALALTCWVVLRARPETVALELVEQPALEASTSASVGTATAVDARINLNTADVAALDSLPGIGPVTAAAIIAWRTQHQRFSSVDELLEVKGIGPAKLAGVRNRVVV